MRAEKELLLEEIRDEIVGSEMVLVMNYQAMTANQTAGLRDELAKAGSSLLGVKKRVFLKVAKDAHITLSKEDLTGHVALVVAQENSVEVTKSIYSFMKANEGKVGILGGQFQGNSCTTADFEKISKLPSLNEMRAMLLGTLEAPMSQTLAVMEALLTSVPHCLENKAALGE